MTPADKLAAESARSRFALEVRQRGAALDLARGALLIAAEEEPGRCDVEGCLALLDRWGAEARGRVGGAKGRAVEELNRFLFEELGFAGNEEHYQDPRNSLLNRVLERRTGLPITLSVVYIEVGNRAGLLVKGVGMPGHFIVRVHAGAGRVTLVDPFYGRVVDEDDCQQRLDLIFDGQVRLSREHLRAVSTHDILVRLLTNLKSVYTQAQLYRPALAAVERILLLAPGAHAERRDRALLLAQAGRLHEAAAELESYLTLAPDDDAAETLREQLKRLRLRHAALN